jgi:hypothetical protein
MRIFPEKKAFYLVEPSNAIDRRIYRYFEVYKRIFWRIYKRIGVVSVNEVCSCHNTTEFLMAKFCNRG